MNNLVAFFGTAIFVALCVIIWWIVRVSRRADRCLRLAVTALAATQYILSVHVELSEQDRNAEELSVRLALNEITKMNREWNP